MNIDDLKQRHFDRYTDVKVYEKELDGGAVLTILWGGFSKPNPKSYMDSVVSAYVQTTPHNQFVEVFLDNPWLRVLIFDFNDINRWKSLGADRRLQQAR